MIIITLSSKIPKKLTRENKARENERNHTQAVSKRNGPSRGSLPAVFCTVYEERNHFINYAYVINIINIIE